MIVVSDTTPIIALMKAGHLGTLGIMMMAYDKGIASAREIEESIDEMLQSGIRYNARLCNKVLAYVGLQQKYGLES